MMTAGQGPSCVSAGGLARALTGPRENRTHITIIIIIIMMRVLILCFSELCHARPTIKRSHCSHHRARYYNNNDICVIIKLFSLDINAAVPYV